MNVTASHYFLFPSEGERLPAYCLKPAPHHGPAAEAFLQPAASRQSSIPSTACPVCPVQGEAARGRNAAWDCRQQPSQMSASGRVLKWPLECGSLRRRPCVHLARCKHLCFYRGAHVPVPAEEAAVPRGWQAG